MTFPYIVTHVSGGKPTLDIAYVNEDGDWFTDSGWPVYPYHVEALHVDLLPIPEGWMDHLERLAMKMHRPEVRKPLASLIPKPIEAPIRRRV